MSPHLKLTFLNLLNSRRFMIAGFLILGAISLTVDLRSKPQTSSEALESADTYIPEGMVLIPVDIQNREALSQLLGGFGVVDLYMPSFGEQIRARKIASGIKIMRAPLNPEVYAVLVPQDAAPLITQYPGPFLVTIQNPRHQTTKFQSKKKTSKTTILSEI